MTALDNRVISVMAALLDAGLDDEAQFVRQLWKGRADFEVESQRLQEALLPFANPYLYGDPAEGKYRDEDAIDCCVTITYGDVRRARSVLQPKEEA